MGILTTKEQRDARRAQQRAEREHRSKVVQARRTICDACPNRVGIICGKCGCPTVLRTAFNAHCPIHKW